MFINKLKIYVILSAIGFVLSGCVSPQITTISDATDLDSPSQSMGIHKNIAVLLPQSELGNSVKTSVQMAFLQRKAEDISVRFTDLSGSAAEKTEQIKSALDNNPDLIIGPIFAEDVNLLRKIKPSGTPVISFTSDASALGNGIMTMSLMPTQSVEAIIRRMQGEGKSRVVLLAPENSAGYIMGNTAINSANIYGLDVVGFYYYTPGDMDSMKRAAENAAMFNARNDANTRAKEILSDILMKQSLSDEDKSSITIQLEERTKADTIGDVPYDSVLFLGNASDSKALGSFMRYFDAPARKVKFYGTAMWDNSEMFRDMTMSGSCFAAMPAISPDFAYSYRIVSDKEPERISTMGYDAAMLAVRALHSQYGATEFLINPSGFRGLDGLVRLQPNGISERALQIMTLDGSGTPKIEEDSANNFIKPIYQSVGQNYIRPSEIKISAGVNPMDYLQLSKDLRGKYSAKTYRQSGATEPKPEIQQSEEIMILPEDSSEPVLIDPEFQPVELDPVSRTMVDEVEVR